MNPCRVAAYQGNSLVAVLHNDIPPSMSLHSLARGGSALSFSSPIPTYPLFSSVYRGANTSSMRHASLRARTLYITRSSQFIDEGAALSFTEEYATRGSADEVRNEILDCYALVEKLGRGAVYFGSSRTKVDHPHFLQALELAQEVSLLLNCTSWTGAGPGMMDAVTQGAMQVNKPVGGFKIFMEAGTWVNSCVHPYLANDTYLTCRFFSARKHGLVEAGVRNTSSDRTAFICLPGGIGTLDEIFEILTLVQLNRIGSAFPVPFLVLNYDNFYTNLLRFMATCKDWGTVEEGEFEALCHICTSNEDALNYLADFYGIDKCDRLFQPRLQDFNVKNGV